MNILEKIALNKRMEIDLLKAEFPLSLIRKKLPKTEPFQLSHALTKNDSLHVIAEIKKASPSKGILIEDFNPAELAEFYLKGGASAISVLTESKYFQGNYAYIKTVSDISSLPVLCKDFMIDRYQLYHAKYIHADAVLLIVKLLSKEQLTDMILLAEELGLDALVEVHDKSELEIALDCRAKLIGVNNRNLNTFETNLQVSVELSKNIPEDILKISESGIFTSDDVKLLAEHGYRNFLIGEALVKNNNPSNLLKSFRNA